MKKLFIFIVLFLLGSCGWEKVSDTVWTENNTESSLEAPIQIQESENQPNF